MDKRRSQRTGQPCAARRLRSSDPTPPVALLTGEDVEQVRAGGVGVVGGVDTHRDFHVGAVVDDAGRLLGSDQFGVDIVKALRWLRLRRMGSDQFGVDTAAYAQLVAPMGSWGRISRVGVGGTGSYGAGLARHLTDAGYRCGGT